MLNSYISLTQQLTSYPVGTNALYSTANITTYINIARNQLAIESDSIIAQSVMALTVGQSAYSFSNVAPPSAAYAGLIKFRSMAIATQTSPLVIGTTLNLWPWEFFLRFYFGSGTPAPPTDCAQYQQGMTGSFLVEPVPNQAYNLFIDGIWYPSALATDADPEVIPYPWTDAVPYLAAYYCFLSAQSGARQADADRMMARYEEFKDRARSGSTSPQLPYQYDQSGIVIPVPAGGIPLPGGPGRRGG